MKVTASEIEGSQVVLDMEIEPERVEKAMEKAYRRIASRVNVPGFRRGKAPRVMVERLVGREALMNEALEIAIPEAYEEAVRETAIEPVNAPKLDVISAEPLSVKATVAVRPKVELGDYSSIRQTLEVPEVTEEQVDNALENLRQSKAVWTPVDREARSGDLLTIDIRGRVEDRNFIDSKGINLVVATDRQIIAPGVAEQLIGMKKDESKAFDATLPEEFSEKELAGKEAAFEATLSEVKEKRLPILDDEFAKSIGEHAAMDELRATVRKELEQQTKAQAKENLEESVLAAVVDQAQAEPPQTWVEEQAEGLRKNTENRLGREGLTYEQFLRFSNRTDETLKDELFTTARRQLKRTLVLDAVAKAEDIAVSDDELNLAVEEALATRKVRTDAAERERLGANLLPILRERKTLERLIEIASGEGEKKTEAEQEEVVPAAVESQTEEKA